MAIVNPGDKIKASHFTALRDRVNAVLGDANVTPYIGYGQTLNSSAAMLGASDVLLSNKILTSQWLALRSDIATAHLHQTGETLTSSVLPSVASSTKIVASVVNAFDAATSVIETSPLTAYVGSMATIALGSPVVNTNAWGGSMGKVLTLSKTFTFSSVNAAKYFFNSGGAIQFSISHPTGVSSNAKWSTFLQTVGVISIKALTSNGLVGSSAFGYYNLPSTLVELFSYDSGANSTYAGSAYANVYASGPATKIRVLASKVGASVTFIIQLSDNSTTHVMNNLVAGTAAICRAYKAVTPLVGIETPVVSTQDVWALGNLETPGGTPIVVPIATPPSPSPGPGPSPTPTPAPAPSPDAAELQLLIALVTSVTNQIVTKTTAINALVAPFSADSVELQQMITVANNVSSQVATQTLALAAIAQSN